MKYFFLSFLSIFFYSSFLYADDVNFTDSYRNCITGAQGPFERIECFIEEQAIQDKRLNDIYAKLIKIESDERKKLLRTAQRSWIKYKEDWLAYLGDGVSEHVIQRESLFYFDMYVTTQQADYLQNELINLIQ